MGSGWKAKKGTLTLTPATQAAPVPNDPVEADAPDEAEQQLPLAPAPQPLLKPDTYVAMDTVEDLDAHMDYQASLGSAYDFVTSNEGLFLQDGEWVDAGTAWDLADFGDGTFEHDHFAQAYATVAEDLPPAPPWKAEIDESFATWMAAKNNPDLGPVETYAALKDYNTAATNILSGASVPTGDPHWAAPQAEALAWLDAQLPGDLRQIAHSEGFAHPILVSGGNPNDDAASKALVHWLDPTYSKYAKSKTSIQAAALSRYAKLQSGEMTAYNGVTLAMLEQDNQTAGLLDKAPQALGVFDPWTPDDASISALPSTQGTFEERIERNWRLAAAIPNDQCSADDLKLMGATTHFAPYNDATTDWAKVEAMTGMTREDMALSNYSQRNHLLNPNTTVGARNEILDAVRSRQKSLASLTDANDSLHAIEPQHFASDPQMSLDQAKQFLDAQRKAAEELKGTYYQMLANPKDPLWASPYNMTETLSAIPLKQRRIWAKHNGLGSLAEPPTTKAAIDNHIKGLLLDSDTLTAKAAKQIQQAAAKKATKEASQAGMAAAAAAAPAPAASAAAPGAAPVEAKPTSTYVPPSKPLVSSSAAGTFASAVSWQTDLTGLQATAAQALAAQVDIPKANAAALANMTFSRDDSILPGSSSHTRYGYVGSDGTAWFGKPHSSSGGKVRSQSEAVAAELRADLGVESVPVYMHQVGSTAMAFQPIISGSTTLGSVSPSDLTQGQVDAIVAGGIADWVIGDHDGNHSNWLKTPNGAVTRCDHGQAFKFYGEPKSDDPTWKPEGNFGTQVFAQVLQAGKSGGLAPGVTVDVGAVLNVVERAEAVSDASWEKKLRPIAVEGAKSGEIAWVNNMRKRIADRDGVPSGSVTAGQIADEFVAVAKERRAKVRQVAAKTLTDHGVDASLLFMLE
jgi:hypothetical protein